MGRNAQKREEWQRCRREDAKKAYAALMKYYPLTLDDLDGEIWRPIPYYEELYCGSNFGRVKSFRHGKEKILKPLNNGGYFSVTLHKDGKPKNFSIHRLVAMLFIPNPENKPQVNHKDGHKFNCHVSNLEWATASENSRHAFNTGLQECGEKSYQATIKNEVDILYIRENPDKLNTVELAEKFGVKQQAISYIQLGKTYKKCGGQIREKKIKRVSEEDKKKILAKYQKGVVGCGYYVIAKEFGYSPATIRTIVNKK